ncbi:MAG: hypothetical protein ACI3ZP_11050 [Candidatus Cryptobacteroides sp.]
MTKTELFIKLAEPDSNGVSRWVSSSEFVGEYASLKLGNGGSWCRASSSLAKKYIIEVDKSKSPGNGIDAVRLNGFRKDDTFNQSIRKDIRDYYKDQRCVMLGVKGFSENTKIEIDHKDGRKDDWRVSNPDTQRIEDFQPLCKAANDVKRQICKECKISNARWDATNIKGNPYPFYEGDEHYTEELGCKGCYQYDPVEYRKSCVRRLTKEASEHTADFILRKIYPDEKI